MKTKKTFFSHDFPFTLVELLTVISIIAVLATLFLGAISGARMEGKKMHCANNLKQIGLGFMMYASDWNGYFIPYNYYNGCNDKENEWPYGIDPYVGGNAANGWNFSCLKGYKSSRVWYCPARVPANTHYRSEYIDYAYNISLGGYSSGNYKKIENISSPGRRLLCIDSQYSGQTFGMSYIINNSDDRIYMGHNSAFNVLFIDGHVKCFKPASIPLPISTNLISGTW